MKKKPCAFIGVGVVIIVLLSISVLVLAADDAAEISKITINEERLERTEDIKRYETVQGNTTRYLKFPEVQRGDLLYQGDIVETFEHVAARIEFTADQYLLLGTGTEDDIDCRVLSEGKSCTMARFEGFQDGYPFWYIKKGFAAVSNMLAADARAEVVELSGTVYYFHSKKDKTVIIVEEGAVIVKARELGQTTTVPEGYQITVTSPTIFPAPPVRVDRRAFEEIHRWMRHGVVVIREPESGRETEQSAIRVSGKSSGNISVVDVFVNNRQAGQIRVRHGEFAGDISLFEGENTIKIQASGDYGVSSDSVSVVRIESKKFSNVPSLFGMDKNAAMFTLASNQLDTGIISYRETGKGPPDTVVEQSPEVGRSVQYRTPVNIVLEQGVSVPNVTGLDEREAVNRLSQEGLIGHISRQTTGKGEVGTIVEQNPSAGTSVRIKSAVALVLEIEDRIIGTLDPAIVKPNVFIVGCPDPAAQAIRFELLSKKSNFQGRVSIIGEVKNIGTAAFESLVGQKQLIVSLYREWQTTPLAQRAFEKLAPGQLVNIAYEQDWSTTREFPPTYELRISYAGNPRSADCKSENNTKQRSGQDINALF